MKKFLIPVLSIMLLLPFMYGGCGGNGDGTSIPAPPDLAGTFGGPGKVAETNGLNVAARAALAPPFENCASFPFIDISVKIDAEGNVEDALICGTSISAVLGTFTGTVTSDLEEANLLLYSFTGTDTGSDLYTGGLVYDNTATHGVFFIHLNGEGFLEGVVERDATSFGNYLNTEMVGSWSGFGFEFNEFGGPPDDPPPWRFEPMDLAATEFSTSSINFDISWTDSDGKSFVSDTSEPPHEMYLSGPGFGVYNGSFTADSDGYWISGFQSPDRKFFGGFAGPASLPNLWSIFALTKQ